MFKPLPGDGAIAGVSDVDPENKDLLEVKQDYNKFPEPYPGFKEEYPDYFDYNKLSGEGASSYFVKTGKCEIPKIKDPISCVSNGYEWGPAPVVIPDNVAQFFKELNPIKNENLAGKCYKPRYAFVNNSPMPVLPGFDGPVPTAITDLLEMNPLNLLSIVETGASLSGSFTQLPCVDSVPAVAIETFQGSPEEESTPSSHETKTLHISNKKIYITVICIIIVIFVGLLVFQ